jgi:hypothetical protein
MFRIIKSLDDQTTVESINEVAQVLTHAPSGRYAIEEVSSAGGLLGSGQPCRRWGVAIRRGNGQVKLDPDPWPA